MEAVAAVTVVAAAAAVAVAVAAAAVVEATNPTSDASNPALSPPS